jgi:hypothetical protein
MFRNYINDINELYLEYNLKNIPDIETSYTGDRVDNTFKTTNKNSVETPYIDSIDSDATYDENVALAYFTKYGKLDEHPFTGRMDSGSISELLNRHWSIELSEWGDEEDGGREYIISMWHKNDVDEDEPDANISATEFVDFMKSHGTSL